MDFHVLGTLEVFHDGSAIDMGTRKQRALLALLLMHANRVVLTDRILDQLWGDEADGKEKSLWVYVSRLRSALEPHRAERGESSVLLTRDHGYTLAVDPEAIDAHRFETAAATAHSLVKDEPEAASTMLQEALSLFRGVPYQDFAYDEFAQAEIARLEELRLTAQQDRIEADLRRGLAGELIGELEALRRQHPLQERPVALLMLALYRAGRQADALRLYQRFSRLLGEELGIEPSPELRSIEEQVLLHDTRLQIRRGTAAEGATARVAAANPFKGLRAFREDDGDEFFGRDRLVADIVRRLDQGDRFLALVGPSGSGKSSLVKAGLIRAIRKGAIPGSDRWTIAQMVPGSHPFVELEAALLRSSLDAPDSLGGQLQDPANGLLRAALRVLPTEDSRLLLVVDQFEELFTLVEREKERERFLAALLPGLDDPHARVNVVVTLRADFYERPLAYPEFATRLGDGVVNVVPLTATELEEAAQKPAERAGVSLEPALLAALLTDVVGQVGALPAFQYTLTELFDRRTGDLLTLEAFDEIGGVWGALTRRAEDLFAELGDEQQAAARQLFLRLVNIAEGDEWGRRRVPASEIVSIDVDVVALQRVIDLYTRHRLLTLDRDIVTGSPTIEVAHEALLTQWERLRMWIEASRGDVRRHAVLTAAMKEWLEAGRDPDYLLAGTRLDSYERWAASASMSLTADQRSYVDRSIERRGLAESAEAKRTAHERLTQRSARRRLWGMAAAVVVLVAVGAGLLLAALAPEPPLIVLLGFDREQSAISKQIIDGYAGAALEFGFRDAEPFLPISDPEAEIRDLLESGPDLVVADVIFLSQRVQIDLSSLAREFEDVTFAYLEGFPTGLPNEIWASFRAEEGSFLVGAAAALSSRTDVIGFIGGVPGGIDPFRAGFEAGARYVKPGIAIRSRYLVGTPGEVYTNPELSAQAARDLYAEGADVVYHATGEAGRVIFSIADELSDGDVHLWAIGVDVDEYLLVDAAVQDHVLTSMVKRHDAAVRELISRFIEGEVIAGEVEMNLANNGFDYSTSGGFLDPETVIQLERLKAGISAGEIVVPEAVTGPDTSPAPVDAVASVVLDGTDCEVSGLGEPGVGDRIRFEVRSGLRVETGFAIFQYREGTTDAALRESGDPFEFAESFIGWETWVFVRPLGTHVMSVALTRPGTWGVVCWSDEETAHFAPVFTVAE